MINDNTDLLNRGNDYANRLGMFGLPVTHMPDFLTTLYKDDPTAENEILAGVQKVGGGEPKEDDRGGINLRDFQTARDLQRQEIMKYLVSRYSPNAGSPGADPLRDQFRAIHNAVFGFTPSVQSDSRPIPLGHTSKWMSAHQVMQQSGQIGENDHETFMGGARGPGEIGPTEGAPLGSTVGRMVANFSLDLPRRLFREHGSVVVVAASRFAPLFQDRRHFLDRIENFSQYRLMSGDPMFSNQTPHPVELGDVFVNGGAADSSRRLGFCPFLAWYDHHPSFIHPGLFDEGLLGRRATGYPFISTGVFEANGSYESFCQANIDVGNPYYAETVFDPTFGEIEEDDGFDGQDPILILEVLL